MNKHILRLIVVFICVVVAALLLYTAPDIQSAWNKVVSEQVRWGCDV